MEEHDADFLVKNPNHAGMHRHAQAVIQIGEQTNHFSTQKNLPMKKNPPQLHAPLFLFELRTVPQVAFKLQMNCPAGGDNLRQLVLPTKLMGPSNGVGVTEAVWRRGVVGSSKARQFFSGPRILRAGHTTRT